MYSQEATYSRMPECKQTRNVTSYCQHSS